jgi:hypothetical protein
VPDREAPTKVRENAARRAATRQGLVLTKARRRDPRAVDYGKYTLVSAETGEVVRGPLDFDEVEQYLQDPSGSKAALKVAIRGFIERTTPPPKFTNADLERALKQIAETKEMLQQIAEHWDFDYEAEVDRINREEKGATDGRTA